MIETSPDKRGLRAGVTTGRAVNVTLAFIFFVLVILALVVVGSLANLHKKVSTQCNYYSYSTAVITLLANSLQRVLIFITVSVSYLLSLFSLQLLDHPDRSNTSHICILYSGVSKNNSFKYGDSYSCETEIYGFAIMAGVFVTLLVVSIARVVVAAEYVSMCVCVRMSVSECVCICVVCVCVPACVCLHVCLCV